MVDGLGVGDVEDVVLRDRRHLAQDGVVMAVVGIDRAANTVVSGPDIFSRGFVGEELGEELIEPAKQVVTSKLEALSNGESQPSMDDIRAGCRKVLAKFIYEQTHRRPMVVPIIMEV